LVSLASAVAWIHPVGVQAARQQLYLTASLRAAWTSTSTIGERSGKYLSAKCCLKSKAPET